MAAKTEAQEEFDNLFKDQGNNSKSHPEDDHDSAHEEDELSEDAQHNAKGVEDDMMLDMRDNYSGYKLPPSSFDSGRTTGVKGVIADARSYEQAKKSSWRSRSKSLGKSAANRMSNIGYSKERRASAESDDEDEEFLERWREARRQEIEKEGNDIRNRRTSPSVRRYGRFDEVDALGYLDAIEKVGRETVVCVFVYDSECGVSQVIEAALSPLVAAHPAVHFVKVHYDEIEFDNAGVPAILAYKNQGDLFANLTYIIDQIPENTEFDTDALKTVLKKNLIL